MIKSGLFILAATVLVSSVFFLAIAEAKKFDSEDMLDCALYNAEMSNQYAAMGKIWIGNPDCDPDEQYKYDKLNGIPTTYEEDSDKDVTEELRDDAYEDKKKSDGEDRDDNKKKNKKNKDKNENDLEDINKKLTNLFD